MQIIPPTLLDPKAPPPHLTAGQKGDQGDPGVAGPQGVPGRRVSHSLTF